MAAANSCGDSQQPFDGAVPQRPPAAPSYRLAPNDLCRSSAPQVADIGLVADGPAAVEELLQKLPPPPGAAVPLGGAGGGQSGSSNKPSPVAAAGGEERGGRELTTGDLSFTRASDLV